MIKEGDRVVIIGDDYMKKCDELMELIGKEFKVELVTVCGTCILAGCKYAFPVSMLKKVESEDYKVENHSNAWYHQKICGELNTLYQRKNHDYGDAFHESFLEEGFAMARVRLTDKLSRFKTLSRNNDAKVKDESLRDTLIDLANYAIMTVMEIDRSE